MVRVALRLLSCAGLVLAGVVLVHAGPEEDQKFENTLKVKTAFTEGCAALKRGQHAVAVNKLESQLALIGDNREYLNALRDAYQGLILELRQQNQPAEAARYQRRLNAIDPGAHLELQGAGNSRPVEAPAPTSAPTATPAPVAAPVAAPSTPKGAERPAVPPGQDPFGDANSVRSHQVRTMLEQADRQFALQKYDPACRLYEQVFGLEQEVSALARERWAYCKLFSVGTALNQKVLVVPPQDLEREVRQAMSITPKYSQFGNDLLRKIQERQGSADRGAAVSAPAERGEELAAVEIKHLQGQENAWSVCETTNFRIFHKQAREHVERVARAAEAARSASARKWFGEVPPTWSPRCDLYLHATKEEYSRETKQPLDCPGHSSLGMDPIDYRCVSRRVDLHCDDLNMVYGVVPHEVTHVVLAGRFAVKDLPRWADEGMAVMSEPRDRIEKHLRNLPQHRRDRQLFAVSDLMRYNEYPEGKYIGAFYAQSVSLVDFLCQQKGTQAFSQFLRDGLHNGYEPALRQHYGFNSFQDLQQRWQAATFSDASARADRGSR